MGLKMKLFIDTLELVRSMQIINTIHGEEDNPFYDNYMSIFSYVLANNGFIHRLFEIPEELFDNCTIVSIESGINTLYEIQEDSHDDDLIA